MGRRGSTGLSLQSDERNEPARGTRRTSPILLAGLLLAILAGLGYLGYEVVLRARRLDTQMTSVATETHEANLRSREALERAQLAEASARAAHARRREAAHAESAR